METLIQFVEKEGQDIPEMQVHPVVIEFIQNLNTLTKLAIEQIELEKAGNGK